MGAAATQARTWLCAGALLIAAPAAALAASPRERAAKLFREGRAAMARSDLATACPQFAESARLDPAPGTLLNLALCHERLGRLSAALTAYRTALALLPPRDERVPFAKKHAEALEPRVARLTIVLPPSLPREAVVIHDGIQRSRSALQDEDLVDPGIHRLTLRIPGREDTTVSIPLVAGERRTVVLMPTPAGDVGAAQGASEERASQGPHGADHPSASSGLGRKAPDGEASGWQAPLGYAVGGLGAASLTTSLIIGSLVLDKKAIVDASCHRTPECDDQAGVDAAASGRKLSIASTATFIGGAAALSIGLVLILTGDRGKATLGLAPAPVDRGEGFALKGRF